MVKGVVRSKPVWLVFALVSGATAVMAAGAKPSGEIPQMPATVHLWDTMTPVRKQADLATRTAWRAVAPADANRLRGDLVVETDALAAAFASQLGKVLVCSRAEPSERRAAITPAELSGRQAVITATAVAEADGTVTVQAEFGARGADGRAISFSFMDDRIIAIARRAGGVGEERAHPHP